MSRIEIIRIESIFKIHFDIEININNPLIKQCISILYLERKNHRHCFKCNKDLYFIDYLIINLKVYNLNLKHLINIWLNPIIELYCCTCFVDIRKKEMEKLIKNLIKNILREVR